MDVSHGVVRYLNHVGRIKRRNKHGKGSRVDYYRTLENGQPMRRKAGVDIYHSL